MIYAKSLRAAYSILNITSSREKSRIRSRLYRLVRSELDWNPENDPALAVAFACIEPGEKYPGWISYYQSSAVGLAVQIEKRLV